MVEIYALIDPRDGAIRYIGKSVDSSERLKGHIRDSRRRDTPVYRWLRKLAVLGLTPSSEVLAVCLGDWRPVEKAMIHQHRCSGRLLNVADGGDEPYCPTEVRARNGANNAHKIHNDPVSRRMWELKKIMGGSLHFLKKKGLKGHYNKIVDKLQTAALKKPELFGEYLGLVKI